MKKGVKLYQTKAFRNAAAIVLAMMLLSHNVVGSTDSLFAEKYESMEQAVIIPKLLVTAEVHKQMEGLAAQRADEVTSEPQIDEDLAPCETPDEASNSIPEATEAPDLDSNDQLEPNQPDLCGPIEEDLEEEAPMEYPFGEFPLDEELSAAERSVSVRRMITDIVRDGDLFRIEATLVGFDGIEYELHWQYNDGSGWESVPYADGLATLEVIADQYNVNYDWRILIAIVQTMSIGNAPVEQTSVFTGEDVMG